LLVGSRKKSFLSSHFLMLVVTVTPLWYVAGIKTLNDQIVSKLGCRVNLADGVNYLAFFCTLHKRKDPIVITFF